MKAVLTLKRDTYTSKTTIGKLYLNDVFICDTLEDVCRDMNKDGDLDDSGESKIYGETAIPSGIYKITLAMSPRFKKLLPLLHDIKKEWPKLILSAIIAAGGIVSKIKLKQL